MNTKNDSDGCFGELQAVSYKLQEKTHDRRIPCQPVNLSTRLTYPLVNVQFTYVTTKSLTGYSRGYRCGPACQVLQRPDSQPACLDPPWL